MTEHTPKKFRWFSCQLIFGGEEEHQGPEGDEKQVATEENIDRRRPQK